MTSFDKREEGFEQKYAHDEELRFKATARRNKLIGLWAAEKLGLSGDAAEQYARDLVVGDFARRDPELLAKLRHDFDAHGITVSEHQVRSKLQEFMEQAIAQVRSA